MVIPKAERDLDLPDKLQAEWSGILSWAIEGAVEGHANGLQPPAVVTDATLEYLNSEDLIAVWIGDCAHEQPSERTLATELYNSFTAWAEASGEKAMSQRAFSMALEAKGFRKDPDTPTDAFNFDQPCSDKQFR